MSSLPAGIVTAVGAVLGFILGITASGLAVVVCLLYFEAFLANGPGHEIARFAAQFAGAVVVLAGGIFSGRSGHHMGTSYLQSQPSELSQGVFSLLGIILLVLGLAVSRIFYGYLKLLLTARMGPVS